jgi:S1-C subfamily serine protease
METETPSRKDPRWTWRSTLAGAVAGGVLAASVAVPVTWATTRSDHATAAAPAASTPTAPPTFEPPSGYGDALPGTTSARQTDATDAQSRGVVLVDTALTDGEAAGTGLVIDASGLVLTNYHVVEGSTSVTVTIATDGTTYDATVVGRDQAADVALLRLDDASGLTTVRVDDDGDPAVADAVTAVGNAEGQGSLSASTGDVVALDRSISTATTGAAEGEHLTGLIQTDAYVIGGYSGGALLDDQGEVVGITTAASSGGATESYAVPIQDALAVADQIEAGHETTEVQIGPAAYLGIGVAGSAGGLRIAEVRTGTPAHGAGIAAGDTVTAVGGRRVASLAALRTALAAYQPGDRVRVRWTDAGGATHRAGVTLGSSPVS